jgi:hypothetical protein
MQEIQHAQPALRRLIRITSEVASRGRPAPFFTVTRHTNLRDHDPQRAKSALFCVSHCA